MMELPRPHGFLSVQGVIFLVLGSLALAVLNIGWTMIEERRHTGDIARQRQQAEELLEPLTLQWQAKSLLSGRCERFSRALRQGLGQKQSEAGHGMAARKAFTGVLPDYGLWTFQFPAAAPPFAVTPTVTSPSLPEGKRTFAVAFQCLLELSQAKNPDPERIKLGTRMLQTLFGKHFLPAISGQYLRGTPVRVTFRHRFQWMVWDFVRRSDGSGAGFLLLVPDTTALHEAALRTASRDAVSRQKAMAGYIRVFEAPIGNVYPKVLERSTTFRTWLEGLQRRPWFLTLDKADFQSAPWHVRLGKWELFTRLIPHSSHVAFVLVPAAMPGTLPHWVWLLDFCALALGAGLLLWRTTFGAWPEMTLLQRFSLNFALAIALPLSLALTATSAYLLEYREALTRHLKERLQVAVSRVDQLQDQTETEYQAMVLQATSNPGILARLKTGGILQPGLFPEMVNAISRSRGFLPIRKITLLDSVGTSVSSYTAPVELPDSDGMMRFSRALLIHTLRRKYAQLNGGPPPGKNPLSSDDIFLLKGYANLADLSDPAVDVEEQEGSVEVTLAGKYLTQRIFRILVLAPDKLVGLMVVWRPVDLRSQVLKRAREAFKRENPDCSLQVLERREGAFHFFREVSDRDRLPSGFVDRASVGWALREAVSGRVWYGIRTRSWHDMVLVASAPIGPIEERVQVLRRFFAVLALLCVATLFGVGKMIWERIGRPVQQVREALDQVSGGNLGVRLEIRRNDELGTLTRAFDQMIRGLALRSKFASLVSGKALDALSRSENLDSAGCGRRARIVALVSDIRSFTTLCEEHPVREITSLLNVHFEEMSAIIEQGGGRVDRFIGDAILAVFEEPLAGNGEAPLWTAVGMLRKLEEINRRRQEQGLFPYAIGVGLAGGEAIIGAVGDPEIRLDFAILGHPMQEATRLETLSKRAASFPIVVSRDVAGISGELATHLVPLSPVPDEGLVFSPAAVSSLVRGDRPGGGA